jgi:hypothetical protein
MQPFLYKEVFDLSDQIDGNVVFTDTDKILVLNNVFKNFSKLQEIVFSMPVGNWKYDEETRNYIDYYDCRFPFLAKQEKLFELVQQSILQHYGLKTKLSEPPEVNWFKQIKPKRNNYAVPHQDNYDDNKQFISCLIYLNSLEDCSGGTAIFNKIKDDLAIEGVDYWGGNPDCWKQLGHIEMKPNRMIIFPAAVYHAAYHPVDSYYTTPRTTMVFWMEIL